MKVSRLNSIEQYVISRETVSIDELCEVFGVSKNTIRRDLNELEQRGHITKVYGGVTATVRRKLGPDIDAACGQLRRREMKEQG